MHTRSAAHVCVAQYGHLKRFLGSKLRNEWDAQLVQWLVADPEFVSYSGLTSFFTLGRGSLASPPARCGAPVERVVVGAVYVCVTDSIDEGG